jgi:hypothetical protein
VNPQLTTAAYLDSISRTIAEIEAMPFAQRLRAIKMTAYLSTHDDQLRDKSITACLDSGLLTSPIDTFATDVQRTLTEVLDGR